MFGKMLEQSVLSAMQPLLRAQQKNLIPQGTDKEDYDQLDKFIRQLIDGNRPYGQIKSILGPPIPAVFAVNSKGLCVSNTNVSTELTGKLTKIIVRTDLYKNLTLSHRAFVLEIDTSSDSTWGNLEWVYEIIVYWGTNNRSRKRPTSMVYRKW